MNYDIGPVLTEDIDPNGRFRSFGCDLQPAKKPKNELVIRFVGPGESYYNRAQRHCEQIAGCEKEVTIDLQPGYSRHERSQTRE